MRRLADDVHASVDDAMRTLKADLRRETIRGDLPAEAVDLPRRRLDEMRREVAAGLRR